MSAQVITNLQENQTNPTYMRDFLANQNPEYYKIVFVCKIFSAQMKDTFERIMGTSYFETNKVEQFNVDFARFFNMFHQERPDLLPFNTKWFFDTFNNLNKYRPNNYYVEMIITINESNSTVTQVSKSQITETKTKEPEPVEDENEDDDEDFISLFD